MTSLAVNSFALAARLAWRQLVHVPIRLASAVAGVVFATLLVFMQLGFYDALFDSATVTVRAIRGDLIVVHRQSEALFRTSGFPRARLMQAHALPEVARVAPLHVANVPFKNPATAGKRGILVLGVDPDSGVFDLPGLAPLRTALRERDTVAFDRRSRPEFGPIAERLAAGQTTVEVGNRTMRVVGLVDVGASFASDGNLITSEVNVLRLRPERPLDVIDIGVVFLRPGSDIEAAKARLQALMPDDVHVKTRDEFIAFERTYWETSTPIGFIFMLGVGMGLIVGMVIVYQILFTDVSNHLPQYATLKAMGYTNTYLLQVVFSEALLLAILGFIPGLITAHLLYDVTAEATYLPMLLRADTAVAVFALIFAMCAASGALAVRKLRDANPADMF